MIVRIWDRDIWVPFTQIRDITDQKAQFIAPRDWPAHVQVQLATGDFIRLEGTTAAAVAADVNRQVTSVIAAAITRHELSHERLVERRAGASTEPVPEP